MALLNNDERKEMLKARQDEMWNLNNGFQITKIVCWQLLNCNSLDLFAGLVA